MKNNRSEFGNSKILINEAKNKREGEQYLTVTKMSSDEVSQLLARTRANRERVNRHLKDIGESPHPIRSPLKERNTAAGISPRPSPSKIKTTYSSRSPAKESGFRSRSPSGIRDTFRFRHVTRESGWPYLLHSIFFISLSLT